ncbi:MAG: hypothetical protein ACYC0V_02110, partial [Armatimonadota bacterium]
YYYSTASKNDTFMAAVSGVGYTYPTMYGKRYREADRKAVFDEFLEQTKRYMGVMDLDTVNPSNVGNKEIRRFAEMIPDMKAIFADYGRTVTNYTEATRMTARNVPVFHAVTGWDPNGKGEQQIINLVAQIKDIEPAQKPAFMHVFICNWFWDIPTIKKAVDRLGPDYVVVNPEHLAILCKEDMEQKQVLISAPPVTIAMEGEQVIISSPVQNVTSKPMKLTVKPVEGIEKFNIEPSDLTLLPGDETVVDIKGKPVSDEITLEFSGPFGTKTTHTDVRLIKEEDLSQPLPGGLKLTLIRQFEAENMPHNAGSRIEDATANAGFTQAAIKGESQAGHLAYGPYINMDSGKYIAIFRMKRLGEGTGQVVNLDAAVGGRLTQSAKMDVTTDMLPIGVFREVPLIFDHPGGLLETRALWNGNISVALDSISLWAIE